MKAQIFKYELQPNDVNSFVVPKGTKVLSAYTQLDETERMFIWCTAPDVNEKEMLHIAMLGTGQSEIPNEVASKITKENFIATIHFRHTPNPLVYHLFNISN